MKKVYIIKAVIVDADRGLYKGTEILRAIYAERETADKVAVEEAHKIAARPYWWMDHDKDLDNRDLPRVTVEELEVEGL